MSTSVPTQACPVCAQRLDAATNLQSREPPEVGDITICINCQTVFIFEEGMKVRRAELHEIPNRLKPIVTRAVRLLRVEYPRYKASRN